MSGYDGEERRDHKNRWSRNLEHRVEGIELELEEIRGKLNEGKHTMNSLKLGQELVLSELSKNTKTTEDVRTNTEGLVAAYTHLVGFKVIGRLIIVAIITLAALIGAIAVIVTLLKTGNLPPDKILALPAVVAPATGVSR